MSHYLLQLTLILTLGLTSHCSLKLYAPNYIRRTQMAIERGCMYIPMRSGELLLHGGNASPGVQLPIFGSDLNTTTSQAVGPSQMPLMNMDWPRETIPSQNPQLPLSRRNIPKVSRVSIPRSDVIKLAYFS